MRLAARPLLRRLAVTVMMAAVAAFTLQGTLIAASQAATGGASNYHHGVQHSHIHKDDAEHSEGAEHSESGEHSHVLTHVHADGTIHRHAIDDDDVDEHIKEHGCACCWNMAVAIGVLPTVNFCSIAAIAGGKLAIEMTSPHRGAEPEGLRRPPRTPSIA